MIKLESIYEGSTFHGAEIEIIEVDEQGVEIPVIVEGLDILMHLKKDDELFDSYSTTSGLETLGNKIIIPEHIPDLKEGKYFFDFSIIFSQTVIKNGVAPGEWEILKPVTKR